MVVVLWSLAVWPAGGVYSAAPVPQEAAPPQPTTAGASTQPAGPTSGETADTGLRLEFDDRNGAGTRGALYRMLAYTVVILLLGGTGLFVVKKVLPKIASRPGKSVSVLETVYLGPKKTLHLLQVGSQRFLVAGSRDQISLLGEVTSAFGEADAPARAGGFASVLKGQDGGGSDSDRF